MLWHYCTGAMTIPVKGASEEDAVFLSRMIEWDSHNHMILTWIRNTSIPSISNLLGSFDDAKSAWDMLTKREEARLATLQAQNKLNILAITPSTPLIEQPQQLGDFSGSSNRRKQTNKKFCNYCKRLGHTIETCYRCNKSTATVANTAPTPPTVSTSQSSGSTINLSSTELQEIIAQAVRMVGNASLSTALSVLPGKSQTWLFDSACCNHMTPHSSLFTNLDPAPHPLNIHIADGSTMHGNSLGFVSTSTLSVPGVFHDPRTGQELGTGPRVGRMFPVNNLHLPPVAPVSVAAATAAVSSLPSLALWHSRLGHAPSSRVQQLVSRGLLGSVSKDNFDCTSCQLGKQPALPFNNSDSISKSTSQQNGRAERKLRHILDTVRALLLSAKIPAPFWGEASLHAVHAINRIPSTVIHNQTPYERLFGSPPNYHHLRSFGSACFVLLQPHEHNKLEPRSRLCCFLGYGETQKGYRCYDPVSHRLRVSRNVIFWEHRLFVELSHFHSSLTNSSVLEIFPDESLIIHELPHFEPGSPAPALPEDPPQDIPPRHSTRVRSIPPHLLDYHCYTALATLHEPQTYREASTDPLWQIAMKEELDALTKNHTWDLVTLPPGQSVVGCKWIYKIKTRSDGSVERYKARLVAKGFTQEYGIDYEETFAPVARISSVCALLAVAAARKWDLFQMDVKNAFLNGDLSEEVYMQPPPGLSIESNKVCHLRRALYGLKQAPRAWFASTILLLLYVDDMIITGDDLSGIQELKDFLSQQFEMKDLGHLSYFLGLEITHSTDGLYITQAKRLVGSLVYLTVTRPDISYAVHQVSQYLSAPRSTHYAAVLRILRYLKDADWEGDPTDRRSTTGYCFLLGSSLISWQSKKQTFVARSSTKAEYRALADTTSELLWLRWLLKDLGVSTSSATPLYCDNQSAIHIAHNDVFHERTKHIEIDCHFIRYHLLHGALKLFSVSSKDQLADIFTKSLPKRRTRDLVDNLNFYYGNYDQKSSPPTFALQFDGNPWATVVTSSDLVIYYEAIYAVKGDSTSVCVAQTHANQFPFISALEMASLGSNMYSSLDSNYALFLRRRVAFGANETISDAYDRIWVPGVAVNGLTAVTSDALVIDNDNPVSNPIIPPYQEVLEVTITNLTASSNNNLSLVATSDSTLPPLINALEIFSISNELTDGTDSNDVEQLASLQVLYPILRQWGGDPCLPSPFTWDWVNCSTDATPRVTALYLSGFELYSSFPDLSSMDALEIIDLHNNSLEGDIPDYLGTMPNLKQLKLYDNSINHPLLSRNLADNDFSGTLPTSISNDKNLKLIVTGNKNLCISGKSCQTSDTNTGTSFDDPEFTTSSGKKKSNNLPAILGSTIPTFFLFWAIVGVFIIVRQRRKAAAVTAMSAAGKIPTLKGTYMLIVENYIQTSSMNSIGCTCKRHPDRVSGHPPMVLLAMCGCGPWLLVVIAYYPDVYALPASFALPWIGEAETSFAFP
ncbi:Retrovirus-related Pol polyprotein from transposon TNT 1-94 [Vitis vinifera]|uniref:Retrovirus-related Pol polyprotein from transposon TNT 1-94 n=1 Tax=Vitis vinifera TaxID=29760 RepID=A0A438FAG9_VITVI|nr:Retrovirus-related Pol polyprotein from transposon TNT 1-94 [Vitis vinifera]